MQPEIKSDSKLHYTHSVLSLNLSKYFDDLISSLERYDQSLQEFIDDSDDVIFNNTEQFFESINLNAALVSSKFICNVKSSYNDPTIISMLARNQIPHTDFLSSFNDNLDDVNYDYDCQFKAQLLSSGVYYISSLTPTITNLISRFKFFRLNRRSRRYRFYYLVEQEYEIFITKRVTKRYAVHISVLFKLFLLKNLNTVKFSDDVDFCLDYLRSDFISFCCTLRRFRITIYF